MFSLVKGIFKFLLGAFIGGFIYSVLWRLPFIPEKESLAITSMILGGMVFVFLGIAIKLVNSCISSGSKVIDKVKRNTIVKGVGEIAIAGFIGYNIPPIFYNYDTDTRFKSMIILISIYIVSVFGYKFYGKMGWVKKLEKFLHDESVFLAKMHLAMSKNAILRPYHFKRGSRSGRYINGTANNKYDYNSSSKNYSNCGGHYDADFNLNGFTNRNGESLCHYDKDGYMTGYTEEHGESSYHCDMDGYMTGYTEEHGDTSYHYDMDGNMTGYTENYGESSYHCDMDGNIEGFSWN